MVRSATQQPTGPLGARRLRAVLQRGEGAAALDLLAHRCSLLVLRDAFIGVRRFEDLLRRSGVARATLAARLATLVDAGILRRRRYSPAHSRQEYRLTAKGLACYPIALALWRWEHAHGESGAVPARLRHLRCGHLMQPVHDCGGCGVEIAPGSVRAEVVAGRSRPRAAREQRRRDTRARTAAGVDRSLFQALEIVGDRWSALLLAALFLGMRRNEALQQALGIASNILADRLRRLRAAGIVVRHAYQNRPLRHEYRLTARGWALYPFALALQDWADRWYARPGGAMLRLRHADCGRRLRLRVVCSHCREPLLPRDVRHLPAEELRHAA